MKKTFITLATMMVIGFVSCTEEQPSIDTNKMSLTFSISVDAPIDITYADIATNYEWRINSFDIYAFDDAGIFNSKLALAADYTPIMTQDGITIKISSSWLTENLGSILKFYIIANDDVPNREFAGTEESFKMILNKGLTQSNNSDKYLNINPPLLFSGVSSLISIRDEDTSEEIILKRREARFDIVNPFASRFNISNISIRNANKQAYVFAEADLLSGYYPFDKVDMADINRWYNYELEDGEYIAKSVFYLYPAKTNDVDIFIWGSLDNGPTNVYMLNNGIDIEANKRYKLKVNEIATKGITFTIVTADYDEGGSIVVPDPYEYDAEEIPAFENILAVDENGILHLNGQTVDVNGVGGGSVVFFKWGSVVAITTNLSIKTFPTSVVWVPEGYTGLTNSFSNIPSGADGIGNDYWPAGSSILENDPDRVKAGYGDPCQLAVKDGYNIGDFVMPKGNPYNQLGSENFTQTKNRFTPSSGWEQVNGVDGKWYNKGVTTGDIAFRAQFYPAAGMYGDREDISFTNRDDVYYWGRTAGDGEGHGAYCLHFPRSGSSSHQPSRPRTSALSVRCIPKDY